MIQLSRLLRYQFAYFIAGVLFNAVSMLTMYFGSGYLTPNNPYAASIGMVVYALFLIPGVYKSINVYRVLMGISIVLMGYGGILKHINMIHLTPELYHSWYAAVIGICIYIFGLILNVIAATGRF